MTRFIWVVYKMQIKRNPSISFYAVSQSFACPISDIFLEYNLVQVCCALLILFSYVGWWNANRAKLLLCNLLKCGFLAWNIFRLLQPFAFLISHIWWQAISVLCTRLSHESIYFHPHFKHITVQLNAKIDNV